ncbi:MAG: YggS family pyridoxal phosphate-dependent enzyme [Chthonomonas sp.]|nr:YggS family pyridoxal phosphate-dependent enzyme [Chthonomonas sp.]
MSIAARLRATHERMAAACESVGRDPADVTLIAVSKTFPVAAIQAAYDAGHRDFGESRWQELEPKAAQLPADIRWHFIGKAQSNKIRRIAEVCTLIHSLESESQILELSKRDEPTNVLLQVNIAQEPQKSGIFPEALDTVINTVLTYDHVRLRGLMTIGPAQAEPEQMRNHFRKMRKLLEQCPGKWLSLGMSGDYEMAIQEGSTHIRVGSAIFGDR